MGYLLGYPLVIKRRVLEHFQSIWIVFPARNLHVYTYDTGE